MAKIALLVGISEYDKSKSGLEPLPSTLKDVETMREVLEHPDKGGFAEVKVLTNPTTKELELEIYDLFAERNKEDLVLFYFSGHGVKDQNGNLYFTTPETCKVPRGGVVPPTAVAASYLQGQMGYSRSEYQVIILDCCFSGAMAKGMTAKDGGEVDLKSELGGKGRAILTSSSSVQSSFQQGESELSIYTQYLVEGIGTGAADRDCDGRISADELHQYASEKVKEAARAMTPQFYPTQEGYNIYLARAPQDDPRLKYRKDVEEIAREEDGEIGFINRRCLEVLRRNLGLSEEETRAIEHEVLEPYRQRQQKVQEYEEALVDCLERHSTLREKDRKALKRLQGYLGLADEDVAAIEMLRIPPVEIQPKLASPPKPKVTKSTSPELLPPENAAPLDAVELKSDKDADYTRLRDLLKAQKWKKADEETATVMLEVAGQTEQGWLNRDDIAKFPCADLRTIDRLWVAASEGRFGFSVQKEIYESLGGTKDYNEEIWTTFGDRVGWRRGDKWLYYTDLTFNLSAQKGHLPVKAVFVGRLVFGGGWGAVVGVSSLASRLVKCSI